jgi:hypothetical protein
MSADVFIAPEGVTKRGAPKGRTFRAVLVASVEAHDLWVLGQGGGDTRRPIWALFLAATGEAKAFLANLQLGKKVTDGRVTWEFCRSAGYAYAIQRHPEGVAICVYLPSLFALTPGLMDPEHVRFVVLPPLREVDAQAVGRRVEHVQRAGFEHDVGELMAPCALAPLFLRRLNARTRAPVIPDDRFAAQVLVGALDAGLAAMSGAWRGLGYVEHDVDEAKLAPGIAFGATHEQLETFLAEQVVLFDRTVSATDRPASLTAGARSLVLRRPAEVVARSLPPAAVASYTETYAGR